MWAVWWLYIILIEIFLDLSNKNSYFMETQQIERTLNALQRTPQIERT